MAAQIPEKNVHFHQNSKHISLLHKQNKVNYKIFQITKTFYVAMLLCGITFQNNSSALGGGAVRIKQRHIERLLSLDITVTDKLEFKDHWQICR